MRILSCAVLVTAVAVCVTEAPAAAQSGSADFGDGRIMAHGSSSSSAVRLAAPALSPGEATASTLIERRSARLATASSRDALASIGRPYWTVSYAPKAFGPPVRRRASVGEIARGGMIGAGIGAVAGGVMELVDPDGEIADVWPVLLAIPGFVIGATYSLVR